MHNVNASSTTNGVALLNGSSPSSLHNHHHPHLPTVHPHHQHPSSSSSTAVHKSGFFSPGGGGMAMPAAPTAAAAATIRTVEAPSGNGIGHAEMGISNGQQQQQPLTVILTIRMLMQGKEVGSIIGKRGDYVRKIREQSGAKINISDGSCPERIVTISGSATSIDKAFTMVAHKFEEDMQALQGSTPKPPITLRLMVPASQCGSLIGKGGAKIREIRDKTGASLQVASEMLSNSTEKAVTISGSSEALIGCMREVCQILLDAPAKGPTIQYKPVNQAYNPLAVVNSAAAIAAAAAAAVTAQQQHHHQHQKGSALAFAGGIGTTAGGGAALSPQATAAQLAAAAFLPQANPMLLSVQEQFALLQQHHHHQQQQQQQQQLLLHNHHANSNLNQFPFDLSRFLLQPNGAVAAGLSMPSSSSASSAAAFSISPAAVSAGTLLTNPALLINSLANTAPSSAAAAGVHQKIDGLELYGGSAASLDPGTLALLQQQQQQHNAADAMALLQQHQHIQQQQQQMMLYQQQQQFDLAIAESHQLSGRAIGGSSSGGKSEKKHKSDAAVAASSSATQQKRFTPY